MEISPIISLLGTNVDICFQEKNPFKKVNLFKTKKHDDINHQAKVI
jgi:hypothetical protein